MSIYVGNFPNDLITDNRLNFNSYLNSNVVYLNVRDDSHPNAVINFKNDYEFGFSNSTIALNRKGSNIFNINEYRSYFNNEFYIKSNLNTSNDVTFIHSNLVMKFYDSNDYLSVISSNNQQILFINNSNIQLNLNNSNKINITSNNIQINENMTFNSNNFIAINLIKSLAPNTPVFIDYVQYNRLDVNDNTAKASMNVINDASYQKPSITINRLPTSCNIMEIYNSNNSCNTSNLVFSINSNGFIGIGSSNSICPIDIRINAFNTPLIFNYSNLNSNYYLTSNDLFSINNRGYVGIGTINPRNQIHINIKDDMRNVANPPVVNFTLTYNSNLNYRTSNIIDLTYTASCNLTPLYNNDDGIIGYSNIKTDNFFFKFTSNFTATSLSVNPPSINSRIINVSNMINNDYITNYGISNIINYSNQSYLPFGDFARDNITYFINYSIQVPTFLNLDINQINVNNIRINPTGSYDEPTNTYNIEYTNYIYKTGTTKPYVTDNFILKETVVPVFKLDPLVANSLSINLKQRLYIEKGNYVLNNFMDTITYIYQPPPNLIYATSNNIFAASLSAQGRLAIGDTAPANDYYLYVNKKSRLDNLECFNLSSIPGKNNINFSYCNISNINKAFFNSNICSNIIAQNGFFSNISIVNLSTSNLFVNDIMIGNLKFNQITSCNLSASSNLFNPQMNMIVGVNNSNNPYTSNTSNFLMGINVSSNNNNGLGVFSFHNNTNPSISVGGFGSNNNPAINLTTLTGSYTMNMNNNNFNLLYYNNIIYKHNSAQNLFVVGASNNIIFDLKQTDIPTNSTNRISIGYPYRYLLQTPILNYNGLRDWETIFNNNLLNSKSMLNVYGNVNLSSINNTPFINCIANDKPSPEEVINVCIGSNITRNGFLLNVEGNAYFSSNIHVESNVFARGTIGNVSDIRIKENLSIIKNPMDKIEKINGYTYTRKDTGKTESGLVAQEVLEVLPEVVNYDNEYYNISYGNMSGLIIEGIKNLNKRLAAIELQLAASSNFRNNP